MRLDRINITSPKRSRRLLNGWEGFFPYYAGFPEAFALGVLGTAGLRQGAVVLDPWNGSGTTTIAATHLGYSAIGLDINPVMVLVARARMLAATEADTLEPLAQDIVGGIQPRRLGDDDALKAWFDSRTASLIRALDESIRRKLVGSLSVPEGAVATNFDRISSIAATYFVALFSVCRTLTFSFRASNPTWTRRPDREERVSASKAKLIELFLRNVKGMEEALVERRASLLTLTAEQPAPPDIRVADVTQGMVPRGSVDFVLTSPPYCTRIDYVAATRVELAVLAPMLSVTDADLSRAMIGSTKVPLAPVEYSDSWGGTCLRFLDRLRRHDSKASAGYYFKTHADYFNKLDRALKHVATGLKRGGGAALVVQDSHYKDLHNDLPTIVEEMSEAHGLALRGRRDFVVTRSMARINPRSRRYRSGSSATEAVLIFKKS